MPNFPFQARISMVNVYTAYLSSVSANIVRWMSCLISKGRPG